MHGLEQEGFRARGTLVPLFLSQVALAAPATGPSGSALLCQVEAWGLAQELATEWSRRLPGLPCLACSYRAGQKSASSS